MANPALVNEFRNIVHDEVISRQPSTEHHQSCLDIITEWCEQYDDVPPKNRAEVHVLDALQELASEFAIASLRHKLSV